MLEARNDKMSIEDFRKEVAALGRDDINPEELGEEERDIWQSFLGLKEGTVSYSEFKQKLNEYRAEKNYIKMDLREEEVVLLQKFIQFKEQKITEEQFDEAYREYQRKRGEDGLKIEQLRNYLRPTPPVSITAFVDYFANSMNDYRKREDD
jgi:hypothetical protein